MCLKCLKVFFEQYWNLEAQFLEEAPMETLGRKFWEILGVKYV